MNKILVIFLGGGVGSVARYGLMDIISRYNSSNFPWQTFGVNMVGAVIIGCLLELLSLRLSVPSTLRYLLVTGFVGGFTTFSAFSLDNALLLERGDYKTAAFYTAASVIGTIAAVFAGSALVRSLS